MKKQEMGSQTMRIIHLNSAIYAYPEYLQRLYEIVLSEIERYSEEHPDFSKKIDEKSKQIEKEYLMIDFRPKIGNIATKEDIERAEKILEDYDNFLEKKESAKHFIEEGRITGFISLINNFCLSKYAANVSIPESWKEFKEEAQPSGYPKYTSINPFLYETLIEVEEHIIPIIGLIYPELKELYKQIEKRKSKNNL
jgi:hypothetical protein